MRDDLFTNAMNEGTFVIFETEDEAEDYVLARPTKIALVVKNKFVVSTFYGTEAEINK